MLVKDKHFDNYDLSIYVNGVEVTVNAKFYDNIPLVMNIVSEYYGVKVIVFRPCKNTEFGFVVC